MVVARKIINLFNREFQSLNQAAIIIGFFTLLSQVLAVVRDRLFAQTIGPSSTLDVYYAAFKIPDFIFLSVASLASITVLLPFLVEKIKADPENGTARKFLSNVFSAFLFALIVVIALVWIFMPKLALVVAPGFSPDELHHMIVLSRIMLLSPLLLGISNMLGSVTQMFRRFFVFALSPVFYNLGIILGIIFFYPICGEQGLAYGVVVGALLHLLIQIPTLIRYKFLPKVLFNIDWQEIKKVVLVSLPRTLGLSISSLELIVYVALASTIDSGSISVFQFSLNLQNVPLGLVGVSYSVAAFPMLVTLFSGNDVRGFVGQVVRAMKQLIFWSLPIMFLFIVLRAQIVRVIFGGNHFSWNDTRLTSALLALFVISLLSQNIILLITRAYYAAGNTRKPLLINFLCTALTIGILFGFKSIFEHSPNFHYFFESLLRLDGVASTTILVLPLAYSVGNIINGQILWWSFVRDFKSPKEFSITKTFFQVFAGSFCIGYVAYVALQIFADIFRVDTFWGVLLQGLSAGFVGIVFGIALLKLLKNRELEEIRKTLKIPRFWKTTDVVQTEYQEIQS
jgi:putative peptidoglycan lipid II flippase